MRVLPANCLIAIAGLLLAACHVPVITPEPLAGPAPRSIGIWPWSRSPEGPDVAEPRTAAALLTDLDRAARSRGYRVPAREVGATLLADAGIAALPTTGDGLRALGRVLDAEALLVLTVREFAAEGEPLQRARWDLQWQLLSLRGHGTLWSYEHHGAWAQRPFADEDPLRPLDAEPDVVPIGGDRARSCRSVAELAAQLHQLAMAHLPPAGRTAEAPR